MYAKAQSPGRGWGWGWPQASYSPTPGCHSSQHHRLAASELGFSSLRVLALELIERESTRPPTTDVGVRRRQGQDTRVLFLASSLFPACPWPCPCLSLGFSLWKTGTKAFALLALEV